MRARRSPPDGPAPITLPTSTSHLLAARCTYRTVGTTASPCSRWRQPAPSRSIRLSPPKATGRAISAWIRRGGGCSWQIRSLIPSSCSVAMSRAASCHRRASGLRYRVLSAFDSGHMPENSVDAVYDSVILSGRVIDSESGLDAVRNIALRDGRIAAITTEPVRGRETIDARGLVVAPGFIAIPAHGQTAETYRFYSLDGVTTTLELELGTSDVDAWYRERSAGQRINYGVSIGHIKVRMAVTGDSGTFMPLDEGAYRASTPALIEEIAKRIEIGLSQGAVDIGAGFPYTPAATRDELLTVFRIAAKAKTPVHVHITPGVDGLKEALSLAIETNAPLHVVHINSSSLAETPVMLEMIG